MLTRTISRPIPKNRKQTQIQNSFSEISRLLSAAVINKGFRELLLSDPAQALAQGYYGEQFALDYDQKALILSIQAENLSDFALQITSPAVKKSTGSSGEWIPVSQPAFALHAK